jgi:N-acetyl-anhydromuramyl-L-alanine amidase AmpD
LLADSIAIRRYHMEVNGWADIGYHFVVERIEGIWSTSLGRPWNVSGAHCTHSNMNRRSLGVCVVGNFDEEVLSLEGVSYLSRFIVALMVNHDIQAQNVIGHRDAGMMAGYDWQVVGRTGVPQFKSCPGRLFPMDLLRNVLYGGIPA